MAQNSDSPQLTTSLPPSTPQNTARPSQQALPPSNSQPGNSPQNTASTSSFTPSTDVRMNPPPLPRNVATPTREMRESSVVSSGGTTRKLRQNLDEHDHVLMLKHCYDQREHYKEGTKAQFWAGVSSAFHKETGKTLAQLGATVGRLVESRRRQISDWEAGTIPQKPGGELNDLLDQWMEFLKTEDGEGEAERMRQVESRRKQEEARKEARRRAPSSETTNPLSNLDNPQEQQEKQKPSDPQGAQQNQQGTPAPRTYNGSYPPTPDTSHFPPSSQQVGDVVILNGNQIPADHNGHRAQKRKRPNEYSPSQDIQLQVAQQQQKWNTQPQPHISHHIPPMGQQPPPMPQHPPPMAQHPPPLGPHPPQITQNQPPMAQYSLPMTQYPPAVTQHHPSHQIPPQMIPEPARRVMVEGQLTKEDWREIMGNDTRLRTLETKIEKIETLVVQNNKLLLQLIQIRPKEPERESDERAPVHLEAEFERDYL